MQENQEQTFDHSEQSLNEQQNPNKVGQNTGVERTEKLQNFEGPERANFNPADDGELDEELYAGDSGIGESDIEEGNPVQ